MRTWSVALNICLCGHCGATIRVNTPIQLWSWPGLRRHKIRCLRCAEGTCPDPIVLDVSPVRDALPYTTVRQLAQQFTKDFKSRAAGEED